MEPRGPDGHGLWHDGPVAFAHRRLKIIDLTEAGSQPMVDDELNLVSVFNGCIYNYQQLRDELRAEGYRFFSTSDTEVIGKAYHRWGVDCVDHFMGMFAFAILERSTGRLILGRDRLGIKPLYLAQTPERLRFASSLPALLAGGDIDTSIDPVALNFYLTFHAVVPPPYTILRGVRKLPPATVRVVEPDGTSTDRHYWSPIHERLEKYAGLTENDWQELVLDTLQTAVQRRMVADVPVGVLLSGGIDSSVIVALLADAGQHGLQTFSIGFERVGDREGDEFDFSDIVAKEFDTRHHRLMMPSSTVLDGLDGAVGAMAEPMVSHDCIAFYLLSQAVSQHLTVVQSGQGADELLAGYDWYPPLAGVAPGQALDVYAGRFFDRDHATMATILQPRWTVPDDVCRDFVRSHLGRPGADTALDRVLRLDSQVMLVDDPVKRVDNMTMAWGLEARTPFLDHEFAELAAAIPPELKLAHGGKGVLKEASRKVLPAAIIDRKKGHFPVPAIINLEGPYLGRVRDALTDPQAKERDLFRPEYVDRLLADPNKLRTPLGSNQLWQLGLLEMWLQRHGIG
jgi:asparagine synthase (glutamine-hydrolysing)